MWMRGIEPSGAEQQTMEANLLSSCHSCTIGASHFTLFLGFPRRTLEQSTNTLKPRTSLQLCPKQKPGQRFFVVAATEGSAKSSESDGTVPSWARLDSEEPPPWAREEGKEVSSKQNFEVPFFVYLLSSAVTAIAAIGSVFEYLNQRPVFGVLNSDSVFYAPLLGFFAFTGIPTSAFLWFKSVQVANKEAEEQDRRDGYL